MEQERDNLYNCNLCDNKYTATSSLNRHVKKKHDGNKSFQNSEISQNSCKMANEGDKHDGKEQFQNSEMYQNSGEVPNQNNDSFKCTISKKEYTTMSILNQHVKRYDEKNQFHCEVCGHSSSNKRSGKRHFEAVHEGKKPFTCEICSKSFFDKVNMRTHITSVHEGKKPFTCEICSKSFFDKRNMRTHYICS